MEARLSKNLIKVVIFERPIECDGVCENSQYDRRKKEKLGITIGKARGLHRNELYQILIFKECIVKRSSGDLCAFNPLLRNSGSDRFRKMCGLGIFWMNHCGYPLGSGRACIPESTTDH